MRDNLDSNSLSIQLIQKHGISEEVAAHLVKTYGGRSWEVCERLRATGQRWPRYGVPIAQVYPYIEAEVIYACREYACTIEDVLSRRTRLAFLNKEAALSALPKVADIMAKELGWSCAVKQKQIDLALQYLDSYGGRIPDKQGSLLRRATYQDICDVFKAFDTDGSGYLDRQEVADISKALGFPLDEKELDDAFAEMDTNKDGKVDLDEFEKWWNQGGSSSKLHNDIVAELKIGGGKPGDIKNLGSGTFFG